MALSREFHWVKVDRDQTPAIPERFNVHAYPSLITLGAKQEKIHRFSGFKKPEEFCALLNEALRRYALYAQGKPWDEPNPRPDSICDNETIETFPAPSEEVPSGLTFLDDVLYVAQQGVCYRLDPSTAEVAARFDVPKSVRDLCTDGERLYAMEYGWTAAKPIHVIDPRDGTIEREIVTEANRKNRSMGASGIAWRAGKLYVLEGMLGRLHEVDPKTGDVTRVIETGERWLTSLAFDGKLFLAGSRKELLWLDPEGPKVVRRLPVNYPLRAVAVHGEAIYLMEQPVFGHDVAHQRVRLWPKRTVIHKLNASRR